jgi:hypothetical protein
MDAFTLPVESLSRSQASRLMQMIRAVPKPAPSPEKGAGRQPTHLPGVEAARGSAGDDHNTR